MTTVWACGKCRYADTGVLVSRFGVYRCPVCASVIEKPTLAERVNGRLPSYIGYAYCYHFGHDWGEEMCGRCDLLKV